MLWIPYPRTENIKQWQIDEMHKTLKCHSFDEDLEEYKKSDILAYWINDFANYHDEEKSFDSTKLKRYKRGDIIKANLGFNVGRRIRWITLLHCT